MVVYEVYIGDVYLKNFKNLLEAQILFYGLQFFLTLHDMDIGMVRIVKEVL